MLFPEFQTEYKRALHIPVRYIFKTQETIRANLNELYFKFKTPAIKPTQPECDFHIY